MEPATDPNNPAARKPAQWNRAKLDHVKCVIAVASGKGGVGKSSTTVNLALALAEAGVEVGILDADIYGPSVPKMLGIKTHLQPSVLNGKLVPPRQRGIYLMSMALITGNRPALLRGPMITKTLQQLLRGTLWGKDKPLDILLVDMPPGTGDVHLSMAQQVPLDGALVVTTPQEVATADAEKATEMFIRLGVPIIGVIENMSYFTDPEGRRHHLFGEGGGAALAARHKIDFLGELPLDPLIGECADRGENYLHRDGALAIKEYTALAKLLRAKCA